MPIFRAPQYTKSTNPKTGAQEPCYTFPIEFQSNEDGITFVAESTSDITLQSLQSCILENVSWWNSFIGQFLQASSKLFSKQYSIEQINKITKHTLNGSTDSVSFPVTVTVFPKSIQIVGGIFIVNWHYTLESVVISIPDLIEPEENTTVNITSLPDSDNEIVDGIEELNIDELPVDTNSTVGTLEIGNTAKLYEKQRVKEARLKAKLAVYKAQRQLSQYYEKYGDDISDSDSDLDTSDEEFEDDDEEEEVQL